MRFKNPHTKKIVKAGVVITLGLLLLKFLPMEIWGEEILFDASMHIAVTMFVLYIVWFFIDQEPTWRQPFFTFAAVILIWVGFQRIFINAHSDIGLMLGFAVGLFGIGVAEWSKVKRRLKF